MPELTAELPSQSIPARWYGKLFYTIGLLVIAERILVLLLFAFNWTTNDDLIFWLGARDYAHGEFHGPFMYGQDYNFMSESLGAVPLIWFGVPYYIALPLTTSFMALFPFFTFARSLKKTGYFFGACFLLAVPLLLPMEWGMMTSMPRGFINGIFFLGFLPLVSTIKNKIAADGLYAFFAGLAVVINPGSVLLAAPLLVLHWWKNKSDRWYYVRMFAGVLLPAGLYIYSQFFIRSHSALMVHTIFDWRMDFHPKELIPEALQRLDFMFLYLAPLFWKTGSVILIVTALLTAWFFIRRKWDYGLALLSVLLITFYSFGFPKTQDGAVSPFYSESRHFLAYPIILGLFVAFMKPGERYTKRGLVILSCAILTAVFFKTFQYPQIEAKTIGYSKNLSVDVFPVSYLQIKTAVVAEHARKQKADLIVSVTGGDPAHHVTSGYAQVLTIGTELLHEKIPLNYSFGYERRYWTLPAINQPVFKRILFAGRFPDEIPADWIESGKLIKCNEDPALFLIQNNTEQLQSLLYKLYFIPGDGRNK